MVWDRALGIFEGPMPLSEFPEVDRREIQALVEMDRPPSRWLTVSDGMAQIESRAWYEWHWQRGREPGVRRRNLPRRLREAVIARDGYVCGLCGDDVASDDVHIDHILPVAHGGGDQLDNLQVAHSLCNIRKGASI